MIRGLLLLTGVLLGLALALVSEARMHHLRRIAGDRLPDWTATLAPDAGLLRGRSSAAPLNADLDWRFTGLTLRGPRYRVALTGPGLALSGRMVLGRHAAFGGLSGEIDITRFPALAGITGTLHLRDGAGEIDYRNRRLVALSGQGVLGGGRFDGADIGPADITLTPGEAGVWLARLTTQSPALALSADIRGRFDASTARIDGVLAPGTDMPDGWQRRLNQNLAKSGEDWQISQSLDLKTPVFGR